MKSRSRPKSMKQEMKQRFIQITFLSITVLLVLLIMIFYEVFCEEVIDDLKNYTMQLESFGLFENPDEITYKSNVKDLRITVVKQDGTVLFDNYANLVDMDNHGKRPEVEQAIETGEGNAVRKSTTLNKSTFYYAMRMENGNVLRVAKEADNVWSMFFRVIPLILAITMLVLSISAISSHYLTKSIVYPIEQMAQDMEHTSMMETYSELQPFIDTIRKQHVDIMQGAQMRQEFTANVSHELKTPLTSISGYAELIKNGMATEKDITRFAGEIHRNSQRLLTLINDIIQLSQLDVQDKQTEKEAVDLCEIAQCMVDMLQFTAEKYQVSLAFQGEPCIIHANKTMMEELVYNLTDNAIRYNREGGWVNVYVVAEQNQCRLTVEDNGIGISQENQERIFERFFRVDKSHSRQIGGTGLGLAIVKHILLLHDTELELESELDVGTKMTVRFPCSNV